MSDFDDLENILRPWLGEVRGFNLPSNPDDIYVFIRGISGHGFRRLEWQKNNADPDWIQPRWRTQSRVSCPRCQTEIQAMLKSHQKVLAPYVFCKCIRLRPSRLPALEFFTANWGIVLEAVSFFERVAAESETERQRERDAYQARIVSYSNV